MTESAVPPRALVIGAGVIGLTTAIVLAEQGTEVEIWTAEPPDQTTSMAAGAMWGPYLVEPVDKVREWSLVTLHKFKELADDPVTGVRFVSGVEASREAAPPSSWAKDLPGYAIVSRDELPHGFHSGVRFTTALIDMPKYVTYLTSRLTQAGGRLTIKTIDDIDEALAASNLVINCTGFGARRLVPDDRLTSIRGQLISVENPGGVDEFFSEDTGLSEDLMHIYPHGSTVILGGVAQRGQWSRSPNSATADAIVERCSSVIPALSEARRVDTRVGLRPTRDEVRVEIDGIHAHRLVHNYGHGGAGVSLSWGCAETVASIVNVAGMPNR